MFKGNLSFTTHVDSIAAKAGKRMNVFRKVAPYMDTKGRARVYKAHVRIEYGRVCPTCLDVGWRISAEKTGLHTAADTEDHRLREPKTSAKLLTKSPSHLWSCQMGSFTGCTGKVSLSSSDINFHLNTEQPVQPEPAQCHVHFKYQREEALLATGLCTSVISHSCPYGTCGGKH